MKRRHRWLGISLFCVAFLALAAELPTASAVRATSLIFAKTTSTTAAPEEPTAPEDEEQVETTAEGTESQNATRKLTGVPQVDYIYDPNLPRELNGYNLSEYPFYETVPPPETIDFKCDGLHDGFYASVPHKCQVYHHCLFGTRYDFLCANYTAFDQKTFICHFVSEVDCKNSPNYFNRNEALYKATTSAPPPPPPPPSTTAAPATPPPRPPRRRPPHRYDYYDDDYYYARDEYDYEDRLRRPRPRGQGRPGKRRPQDDYDDDRYERPSRPRASDPEDEFEERRPYDRRPAKRPQYESRRPYDEDEDRRPSYRNRRPSRPRDEDDDRYIDEDRPRGGQRDQKRDELRPRDKRPRDDKPREERPREDRPREDRPRDERPREERPRDERPREERPREERPKEERPEHDSPREERPRDEYRPRNESPRDEIRPRDEKRPKEDKIKDEVRPRDSFRPRDERRPLRDDDSYQEPKRPRDDRYSANEGRRYRDERPSRREERPHPKPERNYDDDRDEKGEVPSGPDGQGLVKPNGHGLFGKPRMPPKIKRPVPTNAKEKYEYVTVSTTKKPPATDDEYYDYYEDDTSRPSSSGKTSTVQQRPRQEPQQKEKFKPSRPHTSPASHKTRAGVKKPSYDEEDYYDEPVQRPKPVPRKPKTTEPPLDDYYYDDEYTKKTQRREEDITSKIKDIRPHVKVFKRPFLPSRGGSPYLPRGLQPVAGKDMTAPPKTTPRPTTTTTSTTTTPAPTTTTVKITTTAPKITTTFTTEPTTTQHLTAPEDEYEYYDEEDIEYDAKHKPSTTLEPDTKTDLVEPQTHEVETIQPEIKTHTPEIKTILPEVKTHTPELKTHLPELKTHYPELKTNLPEIRTQTNRHYEPERTAKPYTRTEKPELDTFEPDIVTAPETTTLDFTNPDQRTKLASKVLRVYNDNYKAIKEKLESTLSPGDYIKPYLALENGQILSNKYTEPLVKSKIEPHPEISKPYTATGKPPKKIPDNISIKQNLADSIENDYDVRLNEAIAPSVPPKVDLRVPSGFVIPERDYTYSRFRNSFPHSEPQYAASELSNYQLVKRPQVSGVSIRTPNSFYLHPQAVSGYHEGVQRYPRQLLYRQVLGNFF